MAFIQYLNFDGEDIPFPTSYSVDISDVESDAVGETEAGTTQRDVIRSGVYTISVSFQVSAGWLKTLSAYKQKKSIQVKFFDPGSLSVKETAMFVDGYKVDLEKDTSYQGLWKVSFTLKEF